MIPRVNEEYYFKAGADPVWEKLIGSALDAGARTSVEINKYIRDAYGAETFYSDIAGEYKVVFSDASKLTLFLLALS